jgi:hypothetical protein
MQRHQQPPDPWVPSRSRPDMIMLHNHHVRYHQATDTVSQHHLSHSLICADRVQQAKLPADPPNKPFLLLLSTAYFLTRLLGATCQNMAGHRHQPPALRLHFCSTCCHTTGKSGHNLVKHSTLVSSAPIHSTLSCRLRRQPHDAPCKNLRCS